jgi:hypothetical protein
MKIGKTVLWIGGLSLGLFALVFALVFVLGGGNIFLTKTIGKWQQGADRDVFVESPQFVLGKEQEISSLRNDLAVEKDEKVKQALRRRVLDIAAQVDTSKLKIETQQFIASTRSEYEQKAQ